MQCWYLSSLTKKRTFATRSGVNIILSGDGKRRGIFDSISIVSGDRKSVGFPVGLWTFLDRLYAINIFSTSDNNDRFPGGCGMSKFW